MLSGDNRKAAWKTWIDDLEGDARLKEGDRDYLTYYKGALDSGTTRREDMKALMIMQRFFAFIAKNK